MDGYLVRGAHGFIQPRRCGYDQLLGHGVTVLRTYAVMTIQNDVPFARAQMLDDDDNILCHAKCFQFGAVLGGDGVGYIYGHGSMFEWCGHRRA